MKTSPLFGLVFVLAGGVSDATAAEKTYPAGIHCIEKVWL